MSHLTETVKSYCEEDIELRRTCFSLHSTCPELLGCWITDDVLSGFNTAVQWTSGFVTHQAFQRVSKSENSLFLYLFVDRGTAKDIRPRENRACEVIEFGTLSRVFHNGYPYLLLNLEWKMCMSAAWHCRKHCYKTAAKQIISAQYVTFVWDSRHSHAYKKVWGPLIEIFCYSDWPINTMEVDSSHMW